MELALQHLGHGQDCLGSSDGAAHMDMEAEGVDEEDVWLDEKMVTKSRIPRQVSAPTDLLVMLDKLGDPQRAIAAEIGFGVMLARTSPIVAAPRDHKSDEHCCSKAPRCLPFARSSPD